MADQSTLSNQEVEQLRTAGFSSQQLRGVGKLKAGAARSGANWLELFTELITKGPAIADFLAKVINALHPAPAPPATTPPDQQRQVDAMPPDESGRGEQHAHQEQDQKS